MASRKLKLGTYIPSFFATILLAATIVLTFYIPEALEEMAESPYVGLQVLPLLVVLQLLRDHRADELKIHQHRRYLAFSMSRLGLLRQELFAVVKNVRFLYVNGCLLLAFYFFLRQEVSSWPLFCLLFALQSLFVTLIVLVIRNISALSKSHIYVSNFMSLILVIYSVPLITRVRGVPAFSPINAMFFVPALSTNRQAGLLALAAIPVLFGLLYLFCRWRFQEWPRPDD